MEKLQITGTHLTAAGAFTLTLCYLFSQQMFNLISSSVDFVKPDDKLHPLVRHAMKSCQVVMLQAGDVLFIPEGW